ncbi:MAG: DUF4961 domain-containing protein [Calditrichaeota bacterium]|nr:DUF4961 domain-containing protein [Calditrichota bacterium]
MNLNRKKLVGYLLFVFALAILSSCFTILSVDQPDTANAGDQITATLEVRTEDTDANAHHGIIAFLVPNDWTVNSVYYSGDFGPDSASFLPPDSIDADPGGQVDYWTDSLEARYPSGDDMGWVVFQANTPFASSLDTGYVDVEVVMTVGNSNGAFNIGYFVSNAALDFTDPKYYSVSLENPITVSGGTGVAAERALPRRYELAQNFPNPFNPTTTISFEIPATNQVKLSVYDLLGKEVATLVNGKVSAGNHQIVFDASNLQSGIYYYRLESGDFVATKKLLLLK